jgi:hypothetical protein
MAQRMLGVAGLALTVGVSAALGQQYPPGPGQEGSRNMHVLSHVPEGSKYRTGDVEIEQELARPYAYVATRKEYTGFDVVSLKDPAKAFVLYSWRIQNEELHLGGGGMDVHYFKTHGRYYIITAFQFRASGPDVGLAGVVVDVTGLPDTSKIREVRRFQVPDTPGGFHTVFPYKHSDGRALLFAESGGGGRIYDLDKFLAGDASQGLIGFVPVPVAGANPAPTVTTLTRYHDFYVAYDPANHRDVFYGGGTGGYYVFDVTKPEAPKLLTSITGVAGIAFGHTFTPDPTGRYAVAETEYQYAPLRIFQLKPGLDGEVKTISRPIGAWTPNWQHLPHNTEVRWPYVFVSAYEDGLYVFNMMDPTNPYTVGYYNTYGLPHNMGMDCSVPNRCSLAEGAYALASGETVPFVGNWGVTTGTWGVDVRNADGLIVASDFITGFWALKMDGFDGWNGHQWGVPNISSVQDWDNGPHGAPRTQKVSLR